MMSTDQLEQGTGGASVGTSATGKLAERKWRKAEHLLGIAAVVGVAATIWLGLWVTPPAQVQGNLVRMLYIHPPVAWVAYLAFGVTALGSLLFLWPRTRATRWDRLAGASAEIGVVFTALTIISGSIWGKPTWGVWWTWDARLTSTALLLVLYIGYLALRRVPGEPVARGKRSAVAALVAFADIPIDHFSVDWWHTLHQKATVLTATLVPKIHGSMAWTLLLGFVAFTLLYCWMLIQRYRVEDLLEDMEDRELAAAINERHAEAPVGNGLSMPASMPAVLGASQGAGQIRSGRGSTPDAAQAAGYVQPEGPSRAPAVSGAKSGSSQGDDLG